jgi:foldase protein PrsA
MKKKLTLLLMALTAGILVLAGCNNDNGGRTLIETESGAITTEDFYNTMKRIYSNDTENILKDMVYRQVLADKFEVSKDDVDKELKKFIDENFGSQEEYEDYLKQYNIDEETLKEDIEYMLLQEIAFTQNIDVTEEEVELEYLYQTKNVTARHILISTDENEEKSEDGKSAEDKVDEVLEKLNAGEDFAKVAKEYSDDPSSAENGGDLGVLNPDQLVPEFSKAAFQLKEGEISEPVKSDYGYHIIQVTKVEDKKDVKPLDEIREDIEFEAKTRKMDQETIQAELDKLIKDADIKIKDKDFKDIFKKDNTNARG